ncbi:MAG: helix-hairpin-helix domain-containing protein [Candidatus Thorarchaeota archaeon]
MSSLKLIDIKGIGKIVSEKMINHFRNEENAIQAIKSMDINELAKIDGLGQNGAIRIIRAAHNTLTGESIESFLRSTDIIAIYEQLLKIIQNYAWTSYSKSKSYISLLPLSKAYFDRLLERQNSFKSFVNFYQQCIPADNAFQKLFENLFHQLHPLKIQKTRVDLVERVICTNLPEVKTALIKIKINDYFQVNVINSDDELQAIIDEGQLVLFFPDTKIESIESDLCVIVEEDALKNPLIEFIPEKIINFFAVNKDSLMAMIGIMELLHSYINNFGNFSPVINELIKPDIKTKLITLKSHLEYIEPNGSINEKLDDDLQRYSYIISNFTEIVNETIEEQNNNLRLAIEQMNIKLEGKKFLQLLQSSSSDGFSTTNLHEYLDQSVFDLVEKYANDTEKQISSKFKFIPEEWEQLDGKLISRELSFPIDYDENVLDFFIQYIRIKYNVKAFTIKKKIARTLESFKPWIEELVHLLFEFDHICMIGRAFTDLNLIWPSLTNQTNGVMFTGGKNLFLENELKKKGLFLEEVSYQFGEIAENHPERIVLLSGANSGGKTTLLTLISQVVLLGHMGFGVPAKRANLGCFTEIYFFRKPTGSIDAGAFENTIKMFSRMLLDNQAKVVLADEMEAISEPEAAAKVISSVLEMLREQQGTCGVFVSHLADQINELCKKKIRIDGIEAKGLDEELKLIVDRTPKINYQARSTPQLIVERLLRSSKSNSPEEYIYKKITEKF